MGSHSARSLFAKNIQSAEECLELYDGVKALKTTLKIDWILRASVVFVVSALDTYFHDKVKYRVGRYTLTGLPPDLAKFQIPISGLKAWEKADRRGSVIRNWVMAVLSTRPLQSPDVIAKTLKLAGIDAFWDSIEPDPAQKKELLNKFNLLMKRRHQIAHEGDRETSRKRGKALREIVRADVVYWIDYAKKLVDCIENTFPN